jgi:4-cresol dehydrogenase (hydroxylating) flavoprotein subunit
MATVARAEIDSKDAERAIDALAAELGADRVLTSSEELREFRDPFQYATWDDYTATAVVFPETVEEIQAVLRIANEHRVPVWTHGQGRNNGYGGPAPRLKGSIVISLRRMNKVLEINEELGYAVVEPGVRWFDLYEAVEAGGHNLMISVPDLGWGSVIGNTLDNGMSYTPYGDHFQSQCGMEIVLANGDVVRTGMGAMPGNKTWHVYKKGLGPTIDGLFYQSNFGIVTKMGVWLQPKPEVFMPLWLRVWNDDDIAPMLDTLRTLMIGKTIENVPQILNTLCIAAVLTRRGQWYQSPEPIPESVIDKVARELEVGRWLMRFGLYGDEDLVDLRFGKLKRAFESAIPGAEVYGQKYTPPQFPSIEHPGERIQAGVPDLDWNNMTGWYAGDEGGHIGFSPVAPMTGRDILEVRNLLRGYVEQKAGLDYLAGVIPANARSFLHITMVIFDTQDEDQVKRAYDTCKLLVAEAAKKGYGEYRAHLDFMDLAAEQYSFNDHAYRRFNETLKDALDPNGILSPGKQGIWPAAMRADRGT